jgi:hypothetical protein
VQKQLQQLDAEQKSPLKTNDSAPTSTNGYLQHLGKVVT